MRTFNITNNTEVGYNYRDKVNIAFRSIAPRPPWNRRALGPQTIFVRRVPHLRTGVAELPTRYAAGPDPVDRLGS